MSVNVFIRVRLRERDWFLKACVLFLLSHSTDLSEAQSISFPIRFAEVSELVAFSFLTFFPFPPLLFLLGSCEWGERGGK